MNMENACSPYEASIFTRPLRTYSISTATQVDISANPATGAAVESTIYASFSREIFSRSQMGRNVVPNKMVFA